LKYEIYYQEYLEAIEATLTEYLPVQVNHPPVIHEAIRYAVLQGGKRFRPVLTLAACEAAGGDFRQALIPAVALEMIHASSLVHDDLPSLDNDLMRRGKPSCHVQFGEPIAILVGDSLLVMAFHILTKLDSPQQVQELLDEISTAAGTYGMIGGQAADLLTPREELTIPILDYISTHKTGKLIKASTVSGAIAAGAPQKVRNQLLKCGECLGLAFQSVDDLLDKDGYTRLMKDKEIRQKVRDLIATAKREVRSLGSQADKLTALADFLLKRMP